MVSATTAAAPAEPTSGGFRWMQLAMGIVCMAMIANLQYGWTLFVDPIDAKYHWGRAAIQLAFTLFVVTETWLVPVEAWFVDKYGPRVVVMFGGAMIALAWSVRSAVIILKFSTDNSWAKAQLIREQHCSRAVRTRPTPW